jgi:hypothetical protein
MRSDTPVPFRAPQIVAPLSRHLAVADPDRTLAFYRDVLGFDVRWLDAIASRSVRPSSEQCYEPRPSKLAA